MSVIIDVILQEENRLRRLLKHYNELMILYTYEDQFDIYKNRYELTIQKLEEIKPFYDLAMEIISDYTVKAVAPRFIDTVPY